MGSGRRLIGIAALALLTLAGAGIWSAFDRDMDLARERLVHRSRLTDSPFGPIEYAERGHGPAVLAIHGSGGGFDQGLEMIGPLFGGDVRVIAPSRFGYLRSGFPPAATPQSQADALDHLLDRLGVERAVIVGGSAGALSAMQLAIRHPERCQALVLLVPAAYAPDRPAGVSPADNPAAQAAVRTLLGSDFVFWALTKLAPDWMMRTLLATDPALLSRAPASERRRAADVLTHILPVSARREGLAMDMATTAAPPPYALEAISCPVLTISTRDDLYGTGKAAAHVASTVPHGRSVIFEDGGHLWIGRERAVGAAMKAFLSETLAPPTPARQGSRP